VADENRQNALGGRNRVEPAAQLVGDLDEALAARLDAELMAALQESIHVSRLRSPAAVSERLIV
jgi:hypothetical protein